MLGSLGQLSGTWDKLNDNLHIPGQRLRRDNDWMIATSGVGISVSSAASAVLIHQYRPQTVFLLGLAGLKEGKTSDLGSLVVASSERFLRYGSVDDSGGYQNLETKFPLVNPVKVTKPSRAPTYQHGIFILSDPLEHPTLSTYFTGMARKPFGSSDQVSHSTLDLEFLERWHPEVEVENMEGAAIAMNCARTGCEMIEVRALSNYIGQRDITQWKIDESFKNLGNWLQQLLGV